MKEGTGYRCGFPRSQEEPARVSGFAGEITQPAACNIGLHTPKGDCRANIRATRVYARLSYNYTVYRRERSPFMLAIYR